MVVGRKNSLINGEQASRIFLRRIVSHARLPRMVRASHFPFFFLMTQKTSRADQFVPPEQPVEKELSGQDIQVRLCGVCVCVSLRATLTFSRRRRFNLYVSVPCLHGIVIVSWLLVCSHVS